MTEIEKKIQQWQENLIDVSRRNRLLFFKATKLKHVLITSPSITNIFDRLVVQKSFLKTPRPERKGKQEDQQLSLLEINHVIENNGDSTQLEEKPTDPFEISTDVTSKVLESKLYHIRLAAQSSIEEQGVNTLFVALGFLEWFEAEKVEESVRSPIILIPVELKRGKGDRPGEIHLLDDEVMLNPALAYVLYNQYSLKLPELSDDFGKDADQLDNYFTRFKRKLGTFKEWTIHQDACLGLFSFTKFIMFKDLEEHNAKLLKHPVVSALGGDRSKLSIDADGIPLAHELDDCVKPIDTFHILDADSSQQEAIEAAKRGLNLILQGPPGTGKSQTIANIIAEKMAQSKTVLFVSEKKAALEVVYSRLKSVGLDEFCLELHSHKTNKRQVAQEIDRWIRDASRFTFNGDNELEELAQVRNQLNAYVRVLHKRQTELNMKPIEAYTRLARLGDTPRVTLGIANIQEVTERKLGEWEDILATLHRHTDLWNSRKTHIWRGIKVKTYTFSFRDQIDMALLQIDSLLEKSIIQLKVICEEYGLILPENLKQLDMIMTVIKNLTPQFWTQNRDRIKDISERYDIWKDSVWHRAIPTYWLHIIKSRNWWATSDLNHQEKAEILRVATHVILNGYDNKKTMVSSNIEQKLTAISTVDIKLKQQLLDLGQMLDLDTINFEAYDSLNLNKFKDGLRGLRTELDALEPWIAFATDWEKAKELDLDSFLTFADSLTSDVLLPSFQRAFYEHWIDYVHDAEPVLKSFNSNEYQALLSRFRELDRKAIKNTPKRIRASLQENRPCGTWIETASSAETSIVHSEANRKRGNLSIRKLFRKIPGLLPRVKPCFLMSPLSVCQYVDPDILPFDVVIFDEASQIKPEDAIGAIFRSKQVIVVGDSKQLPPTSFFDRMIGDEQDEEEEAVALYESILDECNGIGLPEKMLKWHYRSRDESLIAFSNYQFYNNRLVTFKNASPQENGYGVKLQYVENGVYDRGKSRTNRIEAQHVVQLVLNHFHESPNKSLGIVAFSEAQQLAILEELERLRRENFEFGVWLDSDTNEPVFVKNLENVQGDERDTIFISVGYGKDAAGNLALNFGPLNREGGERRLNVVVTRARDHIKLVSSIRADEIDLTRSNQKGIKLLKEYLQYAEFGQESLVKNYDVNDTNEAESFFEEQVLEALHDKGLSVVPQVGSSKFRIDIAVKDPCRSGRFILGIECDGATYHSSKTARDRDRLRQEILENLGWNIHRIWSRDWFRNPRLEIDKVLQRLHELQSLESPDDNITKPKQQTADIQSDAEKSSVTKQMKEQKEDAHQQDTYLSYPPGIVPYKRAEMRKQDSDFYRVTTDRHISVILQVVEQEGPIVVDYLFSQVADAYHLSRVGSKVQGTLGYALKKAISRKQVIKVEDAICLPIQTAIPIRRNTEQFSRDITQIPIIELSEAALFCLQNAISIKDEELAAAVAKLFGFLRSGPKIQKRAMDGIKYLIRNKRVAKNGETLRLSETSGKSG